RQELRSGLGGIVQLLVDDRSPDLFRLDRVVGIRADQLPIEITAERFQHGEEDASVLRLDRSADRGGTVYEIEPTIRVRRVVRIEPIEPERLQQRDLVQRNARDVIDVNAGRGVVVDQIQPEIVAVHL